VRRCLRRLDTTDEYGERVIVDDDHAPGRLLLVAKFRVVTTTLAAVAA
jgi:hypothetical protein